MMKIVLTDRERDLIVAALYESFSYLVLPDDYALLRSLIDKLCEGGDLYVRT